MATQSGAYPNAHHIMILDIYSGKQPTQLLVPLLRALRCWVVVVETERCYWRLCDLLCAVPTLMCLLGPFWSCIKLYSTNKRHFIQQTMNCGVAKNLISVVTSRLKFRYSIKIFEWDHFESGVIPIQNSLDYWACFILRSEQLYRFWATNCRSAKEGSELNFLKT